MYYNTHNALNIGKKVIYLPSCHSTNDIATELVHNGLGDEGTVVITDNQVGGRGQRGTQWFSEPGLNLTFSMILRPTFLPIASQFLLSQTVALGIYDYLAYYLGTTKIKWPNDVYISSKKVCGTLIENSIQGSTISHSIIGIGVNINQLIFNSSRITSLGAETGRAFVLQEELNLLLSFLDARYIRLRSGYNAQEIREEYLSRLVGYDKAAWLKIHEKISEGRVVGVTEAGLIQILLEGGKTVEEFGLKELEWVWDH